MHPIDVTYGGILADTMGLGKSITTLALIMGSLDEARQRIYIPTSKNDLRSTTELIRSKTTLIIVSPSRKSLYSFLACMPPAIAYYCV